MKSVGIVAEYNPFHKGHEYQIMKIREMFGADTGIVCVMSGDFVQRGEPAMFSKFARAEAAVRCGADLVLELPVHCSVASAERFAEGAMHILGRLGIVDHLVFGSESGDVSVLEQTASALLTQEFHDAVKLALESGCSYPAARAAALKDMLGYDAVSMPNDNLGVEYIKAIMQHGYTMQPVAVKRVGAMHDCVTDGVMKSGSEIRSIVKSGENFSEYVPEQAYVVYQREIEAGRGPVFTADLEQAILARLRMLPETEFSKLPDSAEGLENKLYKACRTQPSLESIYDSVKSKRYTHARIRRMTMCAALGIEKEDHARDNLYARVLALNERGGKMLRLSDAVRTIEVISKPAAARDLPSAAREIFEKTAAAHDLYVLAYPDVHQRIGGSDWTTSPVYIR